MLSVSIYNGSDIFNSYLYNTNILISCIYKSTYFNIRTLSDIMYIYIYIYIMSLNLYDL